MRGTLRAATAAVLSLAVGAGAAQAATAEGRLKVIGEKGTLGDDGRVALLLQCVRPPADMCEGTVRLRHKGALAGKKRFTLRAGVKKPVSVRLERKVARRIARRGKLRLRAIASGQSGGVTLERADKRITVFAV